MDIYKSARKIAANGKLKNNKGVMLIGSASATLEFRGVSGENWSSSTSTITGSGPFTIIPVSVYGVTVASGDVYELN
jgi:hypothetical protein